MLNNFFVFVKEGEERPAYITCSSISKRIKGSIINYVYLGEKLIAPIDLDINIHHEDLESWQKKKDFIKANIGGEKIVILSPRVIALSNKFNSFDKLERNSFFDFNMSTDYCCFSPKILNDLDIQDNKYICNSEFYIKEAESSEVGFFHHVEKATMNEESVLKAINYDFISFAFESTQISFYKLFSNCLF